MAFIIGVSGTTGAGKSTLVKELAFRLDNAACLAFDAYKETTVYPADMMEQLAKGGTMDLHKIESPEFLQDLLTLKSGRSVVDPCGRKIASTEFVVVEEPFGRQRSETASVLDLVAFIETPLDIALARRIVRDIQEEYTDVPASEALVMVEEFLQSYLGGMRAAYHTISCSASEGADVVLDGLRPVEELAQEVLNRIDA